MLKEFLVTFLLFGVLDGSINLGNMFQIRHLLFCLITNSWETFRTAWIPYHVLEKGRRFSISVVMNVHLDKAADVRNKFINLSILTGIYKPFQSVLASKYLRSKDQTSSLWNLSKCMVYWLTYLLNRCSFLVVAVH